MAPTLLIRTVRDPLSPDSLAGVDYVYGQRRGLAERFGAWLVTGPVGRFVAFFYDAAAAVANGLANRLRRR